MELKEFIKDNLPDYESRKTTDPFTAIKLDGSVQQIIRMDRAVMIWNENVFSEAFAAYEVKQKEKLKATVERACKLQREACADAYDWYQSTKTNVDAISNAPQPKIEDCYEND